jgi:hypothetical protein
MPMDIDTLSCWRCGASLAEVLQPFARAAECPQCHADLHVCKLCEFFAEGARRGCKEPVADEVNDKERSNFCGYFKPNSVSTIDVRGAQAVNSQSGLADLFGLDTPANGSHANKAQASRAELDKLFGLDDTSTS